MVQTPGRIAQSRSDIFHLEIRKLFEDLFGIQAGDEEIEYIDRDFL
jgi:hypothetical protein